MTKGSADISATIHGKSVKIEIKWGHDRQSQAKAKYQSEIEKAGGIYLIVHTFDQSMNGILLHNFNDILFWGSIT